MNHLERNTMPEPARRADVLIVGSGIMGSVVAHLVRAASPAARIVMVDGGSAIGSTPGLHLHDVAEPALWDEYNERVASGIQGFYSGAIPAASTATDAATLEPGMHLLSTLGDESAAMPMAAAAWNVGGMGAHWTAAVPWPAGAEVFDFGDPRGFARELATAQRILRSRAPSIGPTRVGERVLSELGGLYDGVGPADRTPQPMPMAVFPDGSPMLRRVGPSVIFPPIGGAEDAAFTLLPGHLAVALEHDGRRVRGALVRRIATGDLVGLEAAVTVVCADSFRTPQLLFASGIRPEALGRYLNEHAFVTGRALLDLPRFGLGLSDLPPNPEGEFSTDSLWVPQNGAAQPFHGQVMNTTYVTGDREPLAHSVGLSFYTPVESRPANRIRFIDGERDLTGMPRFEIEFAYSPADRAMIERAESELARVAERFGAFDPATESALLPPGSSLHQTGTVRMGAADDGTSVCDVQTRVWGFENLFLAGNGVVPTPVVANATLTGAVTAVRAARAVVRTLETVHA
jgi:choline dehydrogenase-like flavoprotein